MLQAPNEECAIRPWSPDSLDNPDIKRFYDRLVQSGKYRKVALTACIHAMLRDNVKWQPAMQ